MVSAVQGGDRAPGEGFLVLWLGGPGRWEPIVQARLAAAGVRVEDSGLDVLVERASQRAPDLIVLTGAAGSAPKGVVARLAEAHPACSVPVVAIGPTESARPKPKSRFGLVATLDREADPDTLSKHLLQLLRSLSRRPAKWRIKATRADIAAIAERFTKNARSGLLSAQGAGAIAFDRSVGVAPAPDVLSTLVVSHELDHLTFHERAPGRIRILDTTPREDQTAPPLEGARIVVIDDDVARAGRLAARIEGAGGQARAIAFDRVAVAAAKALDPTVVVVAANGLALESCEPLWTEPRLVDAALLVLNEVALEVSPALLLGPIGELASLEIAIRKRLEREEALAERLETLGTARWLKVLGRIQREVTFRVFCAAGRGRVDLAGGRVNGAAFRPSDSRMAMVEGRAAIDALLALPFGRVLAGPAEALHQLEGARASRKMSVIGTVEQGPDGAPLRVAIPARTKGLIAEEVVLRTPDRTAVAGASSPPAALRRESTTRPPPMRSDESRPPGAPIEDLHGEDDDFELPTRNYTADAIAELQAELRSAAKVTEVPTEPPPSRAGSPRPAPRSEPPAARVASPRPSRISSRPPIASLPEPLVRAAPKEAPTPPAAPSSRATIWLAAGIVVAISAGGYAAWQLSLDDPAPPIAGGPQVELDPEPEPVAPPEPDEPEEPAPEEPEPEELPPEALDEPEELDEPEALEEPEGLDEPEHPIEPGDIQLPPEGATVDGLIEQSIAAARRSQFAQSEVHARQALAESPHHAAAAYRLAVAVFRQQRPDEALTWAERSAQWDPEDPRPLNLQGDVHSRMGRFQAAAEAYRAALVIERNFGPATRALERLRARGVID